MADSDWMSARQAASRLGVKLATLYAYASRGLVESVPGIRGRGRLYDRHAIERLKARHDARAGHGAVAAGALRWGEPIIETSIADIRADGPYYRGHSVLTLCEREIGFEGVAELLWSGRLNTVRWSEATLHATPPAHPRTPAPAAYLAAAVAKVALVDEQRHAASDHAELARARRLITWLARIVGGRKVTVRRGESPSIAELFLRSFASKASERRVRAVDHALILCAEHELNASTFAARVTASAGADLYGCLGAALHALSGIKHGAMSVRVEALLVEIGRPARAAQVLHERLARGEAVPGFGHPLYPEGDPRARALYKLASSAAQQRSALATLHALSEAMLRARLPAPNLDAGLVAITRALELPREAGPALFAIGRTAGWVAHALEQRSQGYLLRPRARYVAAPNI